MTFGDEEEWLGYGARKQPSAEEREAWQKESDAWKADPKNAPVLKIMRDYIALRAGAADHDPTDQDPRS